MFSRSGPSSLPKALMKARDGWGCFESSQDKSQRTYSSKSASSSPSISDIFHGSPMMGTLENFLAAVCKSSLRKKPSNACIRDLREGLFTSRATAFWISGGASRDSGALALFIVGNFRRRRPYGPLPGPTRLGPGPRGATEQQRVVAEKQRAESEAHERECSCSKHAVAPGRTDDESCPTRIPARRAGTDSDSRAGESDSMSLPIAGRRPGRLGLGSPGTDSELKLGQRWATPSRKRSPRTFKDSPTRRSGYRHGVRRSHVDRPGPGVR
jgi:hypothetical protein